MISKVKVTNEINMIYSNIKYQRNHSSHSSSDEKKSDTSHSLSVGKYVNESKPFLSAKSLSLAEASDSTADVSPSMVSAMFKLISS